MVTTPSGMAISSIPLEANAYSPMAVSVSGSSTAVRLSQLLNVLLPTVVTPDSMTTLLI